MSGGKSSFDPVTHGSGFYLKYKTLDMYHAFVGLYAKHAGKSNYRGKVDYVIDDWFVSSHMSGFLQPGSDKRAFEYRVHLGDPNVKSAQKFALHISPQYGPDSLAWVKNKGIVPITRPFIGTQIEVDCSYYSLDEVFEMIEGVFKTLGINKSYLATYFEDESRMKSVERYVRYPEKHELEVCGVFDDVASLARSDGDSEGRDLWKKSGGAVTMRKVNINNPEVIGFDEVNFAPQFKSYRIRNHASRAPHDPLHHPKLEVSLDTSLSKTMGVSEFPIKDYDQIIDKLDLMLHNLIHWCHITSVVPDPFFEGKRIVCPVEIKKNIMSEVYDRHMNKSVAAIYNSSNRKIQLLQAICEGHHVPDDLAETIGVSRKTIYNYKESLVADGILVSSHMNISFASRAIEESISNSLEGLSFVLDDLHKPSLIIPSIPDPLDPLYFELMYNPVFVKGKAAWFVIHDQQGLLKYHDVKKAYLFHLRNHGYKLCDRDMPKQLSPRHGFSLVPQNPAIDPLPEHIVTSKAEGNLVRARNNADGKYEKIVQCHKIEASPLYLDPAN